MDNVVVMSESRLIALMESMVRKTLRVELQKLAAHREESDVMLNTQDAIMFLNERGYDISKSTFTKESAAGAIPCKRFRNRRLLFSRKELLTWVDSLCEPVDSGHAEATLALAKSANRKMRSKIIKKTKT